MMKATGGKYLELFVFLTSLNIAILQFSNSFNDHYQSYCNALYVTEALFFKSSFGIALGGLTTDVEACSIRL